MQKNIWLTLIIGIRCMLLFKTNRILHAFILLWETYSESCVYFVLSPEVSGRTYKYNPQNELSQLLCAWKNILPMLLKYIFIGYGISIFMVLFSFSTLTKLLYLFSFDFHGSREISGPIVFVPPHPLQRTF